MGGIAHGPDGGEHVRREARHHRILLELDALEVVELRFGPDFEGEAEFTLDGESHRFGPGSFVAAPVGTVHGFRNAGDGELRLLNLSAPNTGFAAGLRD